MAHLLGFLFVAIALAVPSVASAQDFIFNQYSISRISPAARYFTPGSIIFGYNYNGVLKLEMVCRNRIDVDKDDTLLRSEVQQFGFFNQSGFQFSAGAKVSEALNAEFGGNLVNQVTISVTDVVMYEFSAEDLVAIRKEILQRPACAEAVKNPRYRYREKFNDAPAGLFINRRFAIGNIRYDIDFNKDNPRAANLGVQANVTKTLQVKFGLTHLNASSSSLRGERVVIGIAPLWQPNWND